MLTPELKSPGEGKARHFREGLFSIAEGNPYLIGTTCSKCNATFFPPRKICASCFEEGLQEIALSSRGVLRTYSIIHQAPPKYKTPYAIGFIDLAEGVTVFSQLLHPEKLSVGAQMEMVIDVLRQEDDIAIIGYKFKPC